MKKDVLNFDLHEKKFVGQGFCCFLFVFFAKNDSL